MHSSSDLDSDLDLDLDALRALTPTQLKDRWREAGCKGEPPHFKHALLRGLSHRLQTQRRGGVDSETHRLLQAAVRSAPDPGKKRSRRRKAARRRSLAPGSTLMRGWGGETHEVQVLPDNRFRYRGDEYTSLSEIAREITGARWSGPRFFGLQRAKQ